MSGNIPSPYRFVPLEDTHYPQWQKISQDTPEADGVCGEIFFTIENQSEMIIGANDDIDDQVQPFFKVNNQPAIPGSSIKGMIRSMLEPLTHSHITLDDHLYSMRDLTEAKGEYLQTMKRVKSGWLLWEQKQNCWIIHPTRSDFRTIRYNHKSKQKEKDVEQTLKDSFDIEIESLETVQEKYEQVLNKLKNNNHIGKNIEIIPEHFLVLSNRLEGSSKKREFLFSPPEQGEKLTVPAKVFHDFITVYSKEQTEVGHEHWQIMLEQQQQGIPVFYLEGANNTVQALGLTMLFRLPYHNHIHDLLKSHKKEPSDTRLDFASLLFGTVEQQTDKTQSIKGRVNCSLATLETGQPYQFTNKKILLANPKASFYPAYLKQSGQAHKNSELNNYNSNTQISGYKRYLPHATLKPFRFPKDKQGKENTEVSKQVEVLSSKNRFHAKLRLHNVKPQEVGALLWCLTFGEPNSNHDYYHLLGMVKPHGYGKCRISVTKINLLPNQPDQQEYTQQDYLDEFYLYLVTNKLGGSLAPLKAAHKQGKEQEQQLTYPILDPSSKKDQFKELKQQGASLPAINDMEELAQWRHKQEQFEQQLEEQQLQQQKQQQKQNRSPMQKLLEDELNNRLDKAAINKLADNPQLWQMLDEENLQKLITKIQVGEYYKNNNAKVRKKIRGKLGELGKKLV